MPAPGSPLPREVRAELRRVVERWQQLPLNHALSSAGSVRALAQHLADVVAASGEPTGGAAGRPGLLRSDGLLPELGPAVLMDQLTVTVYDACAAGLDGGVAEQLVRLRRQLA